MIFAIVPKRLLIALAFSILQGGYFPGISLAQAPIVPPIPSESPQTLPLQTPPATFPSTEIPPRSYTPPLFNPKTSKQFDLYRLDIGDSVNIAVQDYPEFGFTGPIDSDGTIAVSILGKVSVIGLTVEEVKAKIAYELGRRYLQREPEVLAVLTTPRPVQVIVLGEVVRPGYYTFAYQTPLNTILNNVGGSTPQADLRSIIVRRSLIDNTVLEEKVDLYTPLIKGTSPPQFRLQGGDTIIIPKLETGQIQDYDSNAIARTNLIRPSITVRVLVQLEPYGRQVRTITLPTGSKAIDVIGTLPGGSPLLMKQNELTLLRFDPEHGRIVTQNINAEALVLQGDDTQNITLQDQDVIVTSRTLLGDIFSAFNVITQPIQTLFGFTNFIYNIPGVRR